jgi:hypothetical protein
MKFKGRISYFSPIAIARRPQFHQIPYHGSIIESVFASIIALHHQKSPLHQKSFTSRTSGKQDRSSTASRAVHSTSPSPLPPTSVNSAYPTAHHLHHFHHLQQTLPTQQVDTRQVLAGQEVDAGWMLGSDGRRAGANAWLTAHSFDSTLRGWGSASV